MRVYTVMRDPAAPPEEAAFLEEGFSRAAFFLAPAWMAWRGLWIPLCGYFAAISALWGLAVGGILGPEGVFWLFVLLHFYCGLEGNQFHRMTLSYQGYRVADVVVADDMEEAEIRYYADRAAAPIMADRSGPWGAPS